MKNSEGEIREFKIEISETTKPILENISDSNLSDVVKFFLIFSRFEYALKQAGFIASNRYENEKPNWEEFSVKIASELTNRQKEYKELADAINYLNTKPPRKQIVKFKANGNKKLGWKEIRITPNENDTLSLIEYIKQIRNNLFHGGKYPFDPKKDSKLIKSATTILKHILELDRASTVRNYYK